MNRLLERPLLHPLLFAVYPILLIYSVNQKQLTFELAIAPMLLSLLLTCGVLGVSRLVLRDSFKAGFFTSVFVILFFYFNQFMLFFNSVSPFMIFRGRYKMAIFGFTLLLCLLLILRSKKSFRPMAVVLNVAASALVSFNLISIAASASLTPSARPTQSEDPAMVALRDDLPDIYYILLDGYANARTLKKYLDYDNREFLDFLRRQGFFVVGESYSNYPQTMLSMPATLNMTHLEPSQEFVAGLVRGSDSRLKERLQQEGYRFVSPSEEWESVKLGQGGDEATGLSDLLRTEFALTLARISMLDPIMSRMRWYSVSVRRYQRYALETLRGAPDLELDGPKFVYIYSVVPHPPYVFGPNGEPVDEIDFGVAFDVFLSSWDDRSGYLNQVKFVNKELMQIIPEILAKYGDDPPVIIIQGDHGPTFTRSDESDSDYYRLRFGILNAYHLPRGGNELLYEGITPVNSFRIVLNHYFGEKLALLDDRSFFSAFETPYDLVDITETMRGSDR